MGIKTKIKSIDYKGKSKSLLKSVVFNYYTWLTAIWFLTDTGLKEDPRFTFPTLALTSLILGLGLSKVEFGSKLKTLYKKRAEPKKARAYGRTVWNGWLIALSSLLVSGNLVRETLDLHFFKGQPSAFVSMLLIAFLGFSLYNVIESKYKKSHRIFWLAPTIAAGILLNHLLSEINFQIFP